MNELKIFIAVCEDRHIDTIVKVFYIKEKAIEYCKEFVPTRYTIKEQVLTEVMKNAKWVFFALYGCEGDSVRVEVGKIT